MYILIALLLLGILITVHEFGHFLTARLCGIEVAEYAIGFGPKLLSRVGKRGTRYSLRLIPLGGFCAFYGEDTTDESALDDPRAFPRQKLYKRMLTVLMGPGFNFLLAFLVLMLVFSIHGISAIQPMVSSVEENSPAQSAGLLPGDVVLSINGQSMTARSLDPFTDMIAGWKEGDAALHLQVLRTADTLEMDLTPFYDPDYQRPRIGITVGGAIARTAAPDGTLKAISIHVSPLEAMREAFDECVYAGGAILQALKDLVSTGQGLDQTSGPVGVVSLVSQQVRSGGLDAFLNLLVVISINLGIMNLLPIPGLDGSRFLFLVLEAVRRKPIPPQREAVVHIAGMVFLFAFMIFLTYRDIMALFTR
ncbi:MAG: RIP metalloprotease RseP [Clostridia bacterium]|nr:RIP metalloprotease RseP [Clostridia bacterium]